MYILSNGVVARFRNYFIYTGIGMHKQKLNNLCCIEFKQAVQNLLTQPLFVLLKKLDAYLESAICQA